MRQGLPESALYKESMYKEFIVVYFTSALYKENMQKEFILVYLAWPVQL